MREIYIKILRNTMLSHNYYIFRINSKNSLRVWRFSICLSVMYSLRENLKISYVIPTILHLSNTRGNKITKLTIYFAENNKCSFVLSEWAYKIFMSQFYWLLRKLLTVRRHWYALDCLSAIRSRNVILAWTSYISPMFPVNMRSTEWGSVSRCGWRLTWPGRPGRDGALYIPNYSPE